MENFNKLKIESMIKLQKLKIKELEDLKILKLHYGIKTNAGATRKAIQIAANNARIERQILQELKSEVKNQKSKK